MSVVGLSGAAVEGRERFLHRGGRRRAAEELAEDIGIGQGGDQPFQGHLTSPVFM